MKHWMSIHYTGTGWTYGGRGNKKKRKSTHAFRRHLALISVEKLSTFSLKRRKPRLSSSDDVASLTLSQSYFLHLESRLGPVWRINKVFPSLSVAHVLWVTECNNRPAKKGKGKKFFICGLWKSRYPLSTPKKCSFRATLMKKRLSFALIDSLDDRRRPENSAEKSKPPSGKREMRLRSLHQKAFWLKNEYPNPFR